MSENLQLGNLYRHITDELESCNISNATLEARILLAHAAEIEPSKIIGHPDYQVNHKVVEQLKNFLVRRKDGEPIAYITKVKEFWSLEFKVDPSTLIPRPDSETTIEAVLDAIPNKLTKHNILDLGTGCGCLLLSLLSELPNAHGVGIDIDPSACQIAKFNAKKLRLHDRAVFYQGDWIRGINDKFDIIISNPPYIAEAEIEKLEKGVREFEPHTALSGGMDGLSAYRLIGKHVSKNLKPNGIIAFEIGINQARNITDILRQNGLIISKIINDANDIERCILATLGNS